jgi:hypothetical protein
MRHEAIASSVAAQTSAGGKLELLLGQEAVLYREELS